MAGRKRKKEEQKAIDAVKHQHANYKWIKYLFAYIDDLLKKIEEIENTVNLIREEIEILKKRTN